MDTKRILLIDDEGGFAHLMKMNLEQAGAYTVWVETQGALAVQTARRVKPHLILLDVVMPDVDGGTVAAALQADKEVGHVPIVFLTAIVTKHEERVHHNMMVGFPFLAKPVSTNEVIACIERYMGGGAPVPARR
ncbi:MAG: response regulator [Candidatus Omnitrophica bacterium]|nr:response regulator [Candidatus Omnitrophota bacterium]